MIRVQQTPREKELTARNRTYRMWLRWHEEQWREALKGPHGAELEDLYATLQVLHPGNGQMLIDYVVNRGWHTRDREFKNLVLHQIDMRIVALREALKLEPFDDSLPWMDEEETVFEIIRKHLLFGADCRDGVV
jgi:hypothetical protein